MNVGERLACLRAKAGLKQDQVEDRSSVRRGTINRIENGRQIPNVVTLEAILRACGTTIEEFVFPSGPPDLPEVEKELHWKLSQILKGSESERDAIALGIDYVFAHMNQLRNEKAKESTARKTKAVKKTPIESNGPVGPAFKAQ